MIQGYLFLTFMIFYSFVDVNAQQGITSSGGTSGNETGSITYSIGQIAYSSALSNYYGEIQGIQQPEEIYVTSVKKENLLDGNINLYPNPAQSFLVLKIDFKKIHNLSYQLLNERGIVVVENKIKSDESIIPVQNLPSAGYILNISKGDIFIQSFKILKQ